MHRAQNMRWGRKSRFWTYIYVHRSQRVNRPGRSKIFVLKQFFGPLGVCRSPFQKNNFWGWGRLTRWLRRDTRENHRFWADFLKISNCSKSLICWATPKLSRFLESSWALLLDSRTYRGVTQNNFFAPSWKPEEGPKIMSLHEISRAPQSTC